jgi:hypothetical protein
MLAIVASFAVCKLVSRHLKFDCSVSLIVIFQPVFIIDLLFLFSEDINKDVDLHQIFITINHLTAMINPILYAFHLKDFRKACATILRLNDEQNTMHTDFSQKSKQHHTSVVI